MLNFPRHPVYQDCLFDWEKYRSAYNGGRDFVKDYLTKYTERESETDFVKRQGITYTPPHAKAAVNEVKNAIFNRLSDVIRLTTSNTFAKAAQGQLNGVDNKGSSLDYFVGTKVLEELLVLGKVGIYVDAPMLQGRTLAATRDLHPYFYTYPVEEILSWSYESPENNSTFEQVLLHEWVYKNDPEYGNLPSEKVERVRHVYKENGVVKVKFYNDDGRQINKNGVETTEVYTLSIPEIPFVVVDIGQSLMRDIADYQIALLNIESSDLNYVLNANFPFYTEQYNPRVEAQNFIPTMDDETGTIIPSEARTKTVELGQTHGRRYPTETDRPGFIHPSSEPLRASMDKQSQIRKDIKAAINLSLNELSDKMVSADSKAKDSVGLQNGLAYIALILEQAEISLIKFWQLYESIKTPVSVTYPREYELRTEDDRLNLADKYVKLLKEVPSSEYKREIFIHIVTTTLRGKVPETKVKAIIKEIRDAPGVLADIDSLERCIESGLATTDACSLLAGFVPGEAAKAKEQHAERLKLIQESQAPKETRGEGKSPGGQARGVPDTQTNQPTSKEEK